MQIANDVTELVGNTPLVWLDSFGENVVAKVESFNPSGSVKDRVGVAMIEAAEREGLIDAGSTIIEPTSGNTGIGLAMACAAKGYRLLLTMPASVTDERIRILRGLGAAVELTPAEDMMDGAVQKATELAESKEQAFIPQQFENRANPSIHRETTGPEIWRDTAGKIDVLVAATGTGGTITGISEYIKEELEKPLHTVAVEPARSPVLSGGDPAPHDIQGMGPGFIPAILRRDLIDEIQTVTHEQAFTTARRLAATEGIFSGASAGGALHVAEQVGAKRPSDLIVVILPDTGERYLSTALWSNVEE